MVENLPKADLLPTIPASLLPDTFKNMKADDLQREIKNEFQRIESIEAQFPHKARMQEGRKEENVTKNYDPKILPYDTDRVVLRTDSGSCKDTSYINASYIQWDLDTMKKHPKSYIVTQRVLEDTVDDFWRMIWQERVRIIIYITDKTNMKRGERYWPKVSMRETYGNITVQTASRSAQNGYTVRTFRLEKEGSNERTIYHYHFPDWQVKGVHPNPGIVLHFLKDMNNFIAKLPIHKSPIVVQSTSGTGRAGIIVAIDMALDKAKILGLKVPLNLRGILLRIRESRRGMVQTLQQYQFVYEVVNRFLREKIELESKNLTCQ